MLLSNLNHENIIKVKDFYKVPRGDFISIMEYRDGHDLYKIVSKPERIMKQNKKFADYCYEIHNKQVYLKENFIVKVLH